MKYAHVYALFLMFVLLTSCGQNQTKETKEVVNQIAIKPETRAETVKGIVYPSRANFSGEWKSNQSISMGGNIFCTYDDGDRMRSKTMKIAEQADFLTIEVPNPSPDATLATSQEKLAFDGKETEINHGPERGKKFTAKFSADGQTMTVNSIVHLTVSTPYKANSREQMLVSVTEIWKLSNDGKSISVQAKAKSNSYESERAWTTVFDKVN